MSKRNHDVIVIGAGTAGCGMHALYRAGREADALAVDRSHLELGEPDQLRFGIRARHARQRQPLP
jgi:succinate dehydrogenase/fumarate reductase flavoprotein subunit